MSRKLFGGDLHLGHKGIAEMYRTNFLDDEDHDETILNNFASECTKRDTLILTGDVAFTREKLMGLKRIVAAKKILILGNHCTDRKVKIQDYLEVFDEIHSVHTMRNCIVTHIPIHSGEFRNRILNIHSHTHFKNIDEPGYFNVSLENIGYKPISFASIMERAQLKQYPRIGL